MREVTDTLYDEEILQNKWSVVLQKNRRDEAKTQKLFLNLVVEELQGVWH